ncbi:MAG: PQQ-binding-like beta-propeller repeat protein [Spirochaetaceae bacterium]
MNGYRSSVVLLGAGLLIVAAAAAAGADEPLWRAVTGGAFPGPPVVSPDGRAYVASNDRYLYAYSSGGELLWRYDLRVRPTGHACVTADGIVLVQRSDDTLVAVNPAGKTVWSRRGGSGPACSAGGVIYRIEGGERILALSPRGAVIWRTQLPGTAVIEPVVIGRTVVVATGDGLTAWDVSGTELWHAPVDHTPTAMGASSDGTLHVGLEDGSVIDISAGAVTAGRPTGASAVTAVVVDDAADVVYALTAAGEAFALAREAGAAVNTPRGSVVREDVAALVAREAGGIFMLMRSGELRELADVQEESRRVAEAPEVFGGDRGRPGVAVAADGRAVIAGPGWTVTAVQAGRPAGGWSHARATAHGRAAVSADGSATGAGRTGEIDRIYLSRLLSSPDIADRRRALGDIAARLEGDGLRGSYQRVVEALLAFASGETRAGGEPRAAVGSAERVLAIGMLARIGDYRVRDTLLRLAQTSGDRALRIAILESVEHLPVDAEGRTARMIHTVLRREARAGADSRLGRAGIDAVRGYVSYRGAVDTPELAAAVGVLATGGFPPEIRTEVSRLGADLY